MLLTTLPRMHSPIFVKLEGFLIRIAAYSSLREREIDLDLAKEVLRKIIKQLEKR